MSNYQDISSLDLGLIRKYVTKTLSPSEKLQVDQLLKEHPDLKDSLEEMTLSDLKDLEEISANVIHKLPKVKRSFPYGSIAAILIVLIGTVWYFNSQSGSDSNTNSIVKEKVLIGTPKKDSIELETVPLENDTKLAVEKVEIDTFYTVKKKGKEFQFDIESTNQTVAVVEKTALPAIKPTKQASNIDKPEKPVVEKQFNFIVSLEYRQSVAVEADFASAHKVGNTSAYAGAIAGYEYEADGMPFFGLGENDFYEYLESELKADKTLNGISKKMQARVSFEVNNKGKVNDVKIINCNHKQLCMSLSDIFENSPEWNPATIKGKKGRAHYVIEVVYSK